jgi:hypothetical protein
MAPARTPGTDQDRVTVRLGAPLRARAEKRATQLGFPTLSAALISLVDGFVAGTVQPGRAPTPDPRRARVCRLIVDEGQKIDVARKMVDPPVTWSTARNWSEDYRQAQAGAELP